MTDAAEEIESEDVSLTVGLLGSVTNSTEDLQQEDVSIRISIYLYSSNDVPMNYDCRNYALVLQNCHAGSN